MANVRLKNWQLVTIPANSEVETDPDLRLIAVNEKRGERYDKTWLYRVDWIRRCKGNETGSPCNVEFYPDADWSLHGNGPYRVLDSSHVVAGETQYRAAQGLQANALEPAGGCCVRGAEDGRE